VGRAEPTSVNPLYDAKDLEGLIRAKQRSLHQPNNNKNTGGALEGPGGGGFLVPASRTVLPAADGRLACLEIADQLRSRSVLHELRPEKPPYSCRRLSHRLDL
jgi:hypothetical protein